MKNLIFLDFETYFDQDYSLSKLTTEEYIRDERFKVHGASFALGEGPVRWVTAALLPAVFEKLRLHRCAVVAHHAAFDGAILAWHYGIKPKFVFDTMSMARAVYGNRHSASLGAICSRLGLGEKGTELMSFKGVRSLTPEQEQVMAGYCDNDIELTRKLFAHLLPQFPPAELPVIDTVIRMFTEPQLDVDVGLAQALLTQERQRKEELLATTLVASGEATKDALMSNPKFAALLESFGVAPPMKISKTTGRPTYAFAKTDFEMKDLLEHEDGRVQTVVAARLGIKSTIIESRMQALVDIGLRGKLPLYYNYGVTQTNRLSGGDKINPQNLSRNLPPSLDGVGFLVVTPDGVYPLEGVNPEKKLVVANGKTYAAKECWMAGLRDVLVAPAGYRVVVADSSNIELRVNMGLAGQDDVVALLRAGGDPYCDLASTLYGREIVKTNTQERFLGKVVHLACGFGMGTGKFQETAKQFGLDLDAADAERVVTTYRRRYQHVPEHWTRAQKALPYMQTGGEVFLDGMGLVRTGKECLILPTGVPIRYPELSSEGREWAYTSGRKGLRTKIYGGKVVENFTQSMARNIVMEQSVEINRKYRLCLSTHDEAAVVVPEDRAEEALTFMLNVMRTPPKWWPGLPLDAEGGIGRSYGEAK